MSIEGLNLRVTPQTVQQSAVQKLRMAILDGDLQPGQHLIETELCAALGVSRPSLREALRSLEAARLVAIIPNKGPRIPEISWTEAEQIYQVRALLEGEGAALCAENASKSDILRLRAALLKFEQAVKTNNSEQRLAATRDFYEIILSVGKNQIIHEILSGLLARVNFLRSKSMSLPGRAIRSLAEMRKIFVAIEAGRPRDARKAAQEHVQNACAAAERVFQNERKKKAASKK